MAQAELARPSHTGKVGYLCPCREAAERQRRHGVIPALSPALTLHQPAAARSLCLVWGSEQREGAESEERPSLFCAPGTAQSFPGQQPQPPGLYLSLQSCEGTARACCSITSFTLWGQLEPLQKLCVINLCSCIDAFHVWRRMGFSQMSKHLLGFHSCGVVSFIVFWVITQAASVPEAKLPLYRENDLQK